MFPRSLKFAKSFCFYSQRLGALIIKIFTQICTLNVTTDRVHMQCLNSKPSKGKKGFELNIIQYGDGERQKM